jgi:hypothetical protein
MGWEERKKKRKKNKSLWQKVTDFHVHGKENVQLFVRVP